MTLFSTLTRIEGPCSARLRLNSRRPQKTPKKPIERRFYLRTCLLLTAMHEQHECCIKAFRLMFAGGHGGRTRGHGG